MRWGCEMVAGGGGGKRKEGKEKIGMVCGVGEVWGLVLWKRARGYLDGTFWGGKSGWWES